MSDDAQVAMQDSGTASGTRVPESPGPPQQTVMEEMMVRMASLERALVRMSNMEKELKKAQDESARFRKALEQLQCGEDEEEAEDEDKVSNLSAKQMSAKILTSPEAYWMTPQARKGRGGWQPNEPPGIPRSWTQKDWSQQEWADGSSGFEKGAESHGDYWFQSKTDPWTQTKSGWQTSWTAHDDSQNWWDSNAWSGDPLKSRYPVDSWSGWDSQWSSGWSSQWLRPPDRKDVKGPEVYSGDITHWTEWSKSFVRFLRRRDGRWPGLLERIQSLNGKPVTAEDEKKWAWDLNVYDLEQFKDILNEYLESFTSKDARSIVVACGEHNALDAWRQLAERGFSLRPAHINALMRSALWPRAVTPLKDLEMAIAKWETDVHTYETAASTKVSVDQMKLNLEEMCPEALRKHLKLLGPEKLSTYEAMRAEIAEWVADEVRRPTKPRVAVLEQLDYAHGEGSGEADFESMDADQLWQKILEPDFEENPNQLYAFVKNLKTKKGKGKGKGPRKCFECNSEEHIAANCLIRAERVAAGGPERLPREADKAASAPGGKPASKGSWKGSGKGKGKNNIPTKSDWKSFNPDPNLIRTSQWGHWYGKGNGFQANQQQQLKSLTEDGGWMTVPGAMLSGSLRALTESRRRVLPTKTSANKKLKMQNTFEALQESGELIEDATADEQLERTSSKDPGAWPCSDSALLSECRSAAPRGASAESWQTEMEESYRRVIVSAERGR